METIAEIEIKENDGSKENGTAEEKQDAASFKCKKVPLSSEDLTQILKKNAAR